MVDIREGGNRSPMPVHTIHEVMLYESSTGPKKGVHVPTEQILPSQMIVLLGKATNKLENTPQLKN